MKNFTTVLIRPKSLEVIRKFASIHGMSFAQFCDKLSVLLTCGIDGLMETDIEDLRKTFPYSDLIVSQDIRLIGYRIVNKDE